MKHKKLRYQQIFLQAISDDSKQKIIIFRIKQNREKIIFFPKFSVSQHKNFPILIFILEKFRKSLLENSENSNKNIYFKENQNGEIRVFFQIFRETKLKFHILTLEKIKKSNFSIEFHKFYS